VAAAWPHATTSPQWITNARVRHHIHRNVAWFPLRRAVRDADVVLDLQRSPSAAPPGPCGGGGGVRRNHRRTSRNQLATLRSRRPHETPLGSAKGVVTVSVGNLRRRRLPHWYGRAVCSIKRTRPSPVVRSPR
jgi:hypothetical protein